MLRLRRAVPVGNAAYRLGASVEQRTTSTSSAFTCSTSRSSSNATWYLRFGATTNATAPPTTIGNHSLKAAEYHNRAKLDRRSDLSAFTSPSICQRRLGPFN